MDTGRVLGRGISFPPRVGPDGHIAWSEGEDNVHEAVRIILLTEFNERVRLPDFGGGLGALLFEPNTVTTRHLIADHITDALQQWEPRIAVQGVTVSEDPDDPQAAIAVITYRLVATQAVVRVSMNVALAS